MEAEDDANQERDSEYREAFKKRILREKPNREAERLARSKFRAGSGWQDQVLGVLHRAYHATVRRAFQAEFDRTIVVKNKSTLSLGRNDDRVQQVFLVLGRKVSEGRLDFLPWLVRSRKLPVAKPTLWSDWIDAAAEREASDAWASADMVRCAAVLREAYASRLNGQLPAADAKFWDDLVVDLPTVSFIAYLAKVATNIYSEEVRKLKRLNAEVPSSDCLDSAEVTSGITQEAEEAAANDPRGAATRLDDDLWAEIDRTISDARMGGDDARARALEMILGEPAYALLKPELRLAMPFLFFDGVTQWREIACAIMQRERERTDELWARAERYQAEVNKFLNAHRLPRLSDLALVLPAHDRQLPEPDVLAKVFEGHPVEATNALRQKPELRQAIVMAVQMLAYSDVSEDAPDSWFEVVLRLHDRWANDADSLVWLENRIKQQAHRFPADVRENLGEDYFECRRRALTHACSDVAIALLGLL